MIQINVIKRKKDTWYLAEFKTKHFKTRILDAVAQGKLYNNNVFKQHFKGL
jgi:hypothetical protein